MPISSNCNLVISRKLDIPHYLSRLLFRTNCIKNQAEVLPNKAFISYLLSSNGSILTPNVTSHSEFHLLILPSCTLTTPQAMLVYKQKQHLKQQTGLNYEKSSISQILKWLT